jgi:peptidoglycan/LPS O-acetylase OafA/YrhL
MQERDRSRNWLLNRRSGTLRTTGPCDADGRPPILESTVKAPRIASLDGWRALSILMVLAGHAATSISYRLPTPFELVFENASLGVFIFFVISGFLITSLLLDEYRLTGDVSIKQFYARRAFRIWPAFYVFIIVVALLGSLGVLTVRPAEIMAAGLYIWNYFPGGRTWFLGHTWSLAIEEQFYAVWPVVLKFARRRASWIALGIILISPVIRVATYLLFPSLRGHIPIMLHTRADTLMFGASLALLRREPWFISAIDWAFRHKLPAFGAAFMFVVSPGLAWLWKGAYFLPFGQTVDGICISLLLLWSVQNEKSPFVRFLNWGPLVHIGLISYSLYLWNPLFLGPEGPLMGVPLPLRLIALFVVAECSYRFVEQPFLRMRSRLVKPQPVLGRDDVPGTRLSPSHRPDLAVRT